MNPAARAFLQTARLLCSNCSNATLKCEQSDLQWACLYQQSRGVKILGSDRKLQDIQNGLISTERFCTSEATEKAEGWMVEHSRWPRGGGFVHKLAAIDPSAIVEIGAVIHEHAQVGPHSHIGSGSVVGPRVTIGSYSTLWYNVSLQNSHVGDQCTIHSGVCIGQDGFGFFVDDQGNMIKKPQVLQVNIGNNVEIGANCCIDRGSWRNTVIGDHTKIDNQVQIGHNVVIGRSCMICGQVGVGGSSTIGDFVVLGGKCGIADHISITSKVRIAAKSGVTRSIAKPGDYAGFPAVPAAEWRRSMARFCKLGHSTQGAF